MIRPVQHHEATSTLDHVALLTRSIEQSCRVLGCPADDIDEFPAEGTRELYIGDPDRPRLLLMEAIGPGPYQRALAKRGPGLHHAALRVSSPRAFAVASGWLVHPRALEEPDRMLWLAHPSVPCLLEVMAAPPQARGGLRLELPGRASLVAGLGCADIAHGAQAQLAWGGQRYAIAQLV